MCRRAFLLGSAAAAVSDPDVSADAVAVVDAKPAPMSRAAALAAMSADELRAECIRLDTALSDATAARAMLAASVDVQRARVAVLEDRERQPAPVPPQIGPRSKG